MHGSSAPSGPLPKKGQSEGTYCRFDGSTIFFFSGRSGWKMVTITNKDKTGQVWVSKCYISVYVSKETDEHCHYILAIQELCIVAFLRWQTEWLQFVEIFARDVEAKWLQPGYYKVLFNYEIDRLSCSHFFALSLLFFIRDKCSNYLLKTVPTPISRVRNLHLEWLRMT